MGKYRDITNKKFGKLLAIKKIQNPEGIKTGEYWECICDCDNRLPVRKGNLLSGHTTSCGCYKKENHKKNMAKYDGNDTVFNRFYVSIQRHAKDIKVIFELNKNQVKIISQKNCFYCEIQPSRIWIAENKNGSLIYNGIDRINSSLGYIEDNVVPCCWDCNSAKGKLSKNEFLNWINKIYINFIDNKKYEEYNSSKILK